MRVLAVYRHPRFSPNSVEKDRAIMQAVVARLGKLGVCTEETGSLDGANWEFERSKPYDVILSMDRLPETLSWLGRQKGVIINRPEAVAGCSRRHISQLMSQLHIAAPPAEGSAGYWLKRDDSSACQQGDVVYCRDVAELHLQQRRFAERGITDAVVCAHVEGDVLKFYGVRGTPFFRWFYPTDDGDTKFGDEAHNGPAAHHPFSAAQLQADATHLAAALGLDVYGGDAIVRPDGTYCVIDFNDWPSFSRCREEAADAIVCLLKDKYGEEF